VVYPLEGPIYLTNITKRFPYVNEEYLDMPSIFSGPHGRAQSLMVLVMDSPMEVPQFKDCIKWLHMCLHHV